MPLVDRNVRLAVDGRVVLLVHGRDGTLSAILSQRDEDFVDVVEIMLRRPNDLRVVRHGNLADRFTYSRSATSDPVSDPLFGGAQRVSPFEITYSRSATSDPVSDHSSGGTQ